MKSWTRGALALALCGVASLATESASAAPTPGNPTDHFQNRRAIGQEGLFILGNAANQSPVGVNRLNTSNNGGEELQSRSEEDTFPIAGGPFDVVEADLATVTDPEDPDAGPRPALEPGAATFGAPVTDNPCPAPGPGQTPLCLSWQPPVYEDDDPNDSLPRTFSELGLPLTLTLGNLANVAPGSDVSVVEGAFVPGQGKSLMVSWVESVGASTDLRIAHVAVARDSDGIPLSLELDGVLSLGSVVEDQAPSGSRRVTNASLAAGDFTRSGSDQLAVTWAPQGSVNGARRFRAALYDVAPTGGLEELIAPQTIDATILGTPNASPIQYSPGAVALRDVRQGTPARDQLVIGPGISGDSGLYRLTPDAENGPLTFDVDRLTFNVVVAGQPYRLDHYDLEAAGDLDGDGLEELVSTTHDLTDDGTNRIEILNVAPGGNNGQFSRTWLGQFPGLQIDSAVVDARPVSRQAIVPVPGRTSREYNAQIAVSTHTFDAQPVPFGLQSDVIRFFDINADGSASENGGVALSGQYLGAPSDPVAEIEPFALDGRVELGDPVQGSYTELDPMVVLNAPPTHFDILDGQSYDPNFCYAGNQYAVPEVCAFKSQYEKSATSEEEVTTESTEDWAVSAEANVSYKMLGAIEIAAQLRGGYGENYKDIGVETTRDTVTVQVKAQNTDKIYAVKRYFDTLEYPLFQPGIGVPSAFVVSATPHTVSRKWIDSSSPDAVDFNTNHQPGNILSYPENRTKVENPFISSTDPVGPDDPPHPDTFVQDDFELSDSSNYEYGLTKERMVSDSAATEKKWNIGATAKVGVSGGIEGIIEVGGSLEVKGDYSSSDLSTTKTQVGNTTSLKSIMGGGIDESIGEVAYTVKPFAYWSATGALVMDYAVEPSVAQPGDPKTWWQLKYGSKSDLTLNLPRLLDFEEQAGISSDAARFISPGVHVYEGACDTAKPLPPEGIETGQPLCLTAQVENYSLKDQFGATTVQFYDADPDVGGEPIGDPVFVNAGVAARDHRLATMEWTPDRRFAGTRPRIFAVVDSGDQVDEVHENNNKGFRSYRASASSLAALHAPQDVLADLGGGRSLDVSWEVPDALLGQPPHEFRACAYPESGGNPTCVTVASSERTATIDDLAPDRYRVAIFSVALGGGESSPASHPAEPVTISTSEPDAPTNLQAHAGNASVELSWDPPVDTGGGPIDYYRIREYRAPGESFPQVPVDTTVTGGVTALSLSGLTNGRPYRFTVQAVNGQGAGGQSDPSAAVTPRDVPDRPTNVEAAGSTGGIAKVTWAVPANDPGRAAVSGYQIVASPGGAVRNVPAGVEQIDFDGLSPGTAYTFRVRANSAIGFGPESQPSGPATPADPPTVPRNLTAGPGLTSGTARVGWDPPDDDGGVPIASYEACVIGGGCQRVPASRTEATFSDVPTTVPLKFRVSARNEADLDSPVAETANSITLDQVPTVAFTEAPQDGSYTGSNVVIEFAATPVDAETECVIDGLAKPCRSPLRLGELSDGSHTIQVSAESSGGKVRTPLIAWNVDGVLPAARLKSMRKLIRRDDPPLRYSGADAGGSGLAGFEVRSRASGRQKGFETQVTTADSRSTPTLEVPAGKTVCTSVRAKDGAGNASAWTGERCTTRPFDESALRKEGKWKRVRDKRFSSRHALQAKRDGASLTFLLGRTDRVKVLADRCSYCGRLAVEVRGHRRKKIDLSKTRKRKPRITAFNAKWPKQRDGRLRLISLGGGPVRIDGVAVWRTHK